MRSAARSAGATSRKDCTACCLLSGGSSSTSTASTVTNHRLLDPSVRAWKCSGFTDSVSSCHRRGDDQGDRAAAAETRLRRAQGSLIGAASMGLVANTFGIAAAIETTAALQAAAVLFFALRVPDPPRAKGL